MWFAKYYLGDQVKEGEMCEGCVMYGGEEKRLQVFGGETRQERNHLEDPGIGTRAVFRGVGAVEWIYLAQCKNKRRALVNTALNTWIA